MMHMFRISDMCIDLIRIPSYRVDNRKGTIEVLSNNFRRICRFRDMIDFHETLTLLISAYIKFGVNLIKDSDDVIAMYHNPLIFDALYVEERRGVLRLDDSPCKDWVIAIQTVYGNIEIISPFTTYNDTIGHMNIIADAADNAKSTFRRLSS